MSEAIFSLIGVGLGSMVAFLTGWFLYSREVSEKKRIEEVTKFNNHSRIFRKIVYYSEKFLLFAQNVEIFHEVYATEVHKKASDLLSFIENIDDSQLDGEGIKIYYSYLEAVRTLSNNIFERVEQFDPESTRYPDVDVAGTKERLQKLNEFTQRIKESQINKKI